LLQENKTDSTSTVAAIVEQQVEHDDDDDDDDDEEACERVADEGQVYRSDSEPWLGLEQHNTVSLSSRR